MDLTKITTPFGLLDKETQDALCAWPHVLQIFWESGWTDFDKFSPLQNHRTYRARPAPKKPQEIWVAIYHGGYVGGAYDTEELARTNSSAAERVALFREVMDGEAQ